MTRSSKIGPAKVEVDKNYAEPTANETWYKKVPCVYWYSGKKEAGFRVVDVFFVWFSFSSFFVGRSCSFIFHLVCRSQLSPGERPMCQFAHLKWEPAQTQNRWRKRLNSLPSLRKLPKMGICTTPRWLREIGLNVFPATNLSAFFKFFVCGLWIFKTQRFSRRSFKVFQVNKFQTYWKLVFRRVKRSLACRTLLLTNILGFRTLTVFPGASQAGISNCWSSYVWCFFR